MRCSLRVLALGFANMCEQDGCGMQLWWQCKMSVSVATFSESWTMKGYIQLSLHGFWLTGHSTLSSYVLVLMSYEMKEVRDDIRKTGKILRWLKCHLMWLIAVISFLNMA